MTDYVCPDCGYTRDIFNVDRVHACNIAEVRRRARAPLVEALTRIHRACTTALDSDRSLTLEERRESFGYHTAKLIRIDKLARSALLRAEESGQ